MFRDWAADAPDEASMLAAVITGPPSLSCRRNWSDRRRSRSLAAGVAISMRVPRLSSRCARSAPRPLFRSDAVCRVAGNAGWQRGPGPTQLLPWWLRRRPRRRDHRHRARTRRPHALADVTDPLSIRWAVRSDESGAAPPHSAAGAPPIPTTSSRPGPTRPRTSWPPAARPPRRTWPRRNGGGTCWPSSSSARCAGGGWNQPGPTGKPPTGAATVTAALPDQTRAGRNAYVREDRILPHLPALHLLLTGTESPGAEAGAPEPGST